MECRGGGGGGGGGGGNILRLTYWILLGSDVINLILKRVFERPLPQAFRERHAFRGPVRELARNLVYLFTPSAENNVRCAVTLKRLKRTQLK